MVIPDALMASHNTRVVASALKTTSLRKFGQKPSILSLPGHIFCPSVININVLPRLRAKGAGKLPPSHNPCHLGDKVNHPHISPTEIFVSPLGVMASRA